MSVIKDLLLKLHLFLGGTSPLTGYLGALVFLGQAAVMVQQATDLGGVPTNWNEWFVLLTGVGLRLAKDFNKTNAAVPTSVPQKVPVPIVPEEPTPTVSKVKEL